MLVHGVGKNDVDYRVVIIDENGKRNYCPFYSIWRCMLKRCYSEKALKAGATYSNCYVCDAWISLSNFKLWMEQQPWQGNQLDKDIIKPGNNIYCSELCAFVPNHVNSSIVDRKAARGVLPQGVNECKGKSKNQFQAQISKNMEKLTIGYFRTKEEASTAYKTAKAEYLLELAGNQEDSRVANGLRLHAQLYLNGDKT